MKIRGLDVSVLIVNSGLNSALEYRHDKQWTSLQ